MRGFRRALAFGLAVAAITPAAAWALRGFIVGVALALAAALALTAVRRGPRTAQS
jgi:hypothetical protein